MHFDSEIEKLKSKLSEIDISVNSFQDSVTSKVDDGLEKIWQ